MATLEFMFGMSPNLSGNMLSKCWISSIKILARPVVEGGVEGTAVLQNSDKRRAPLRRTNRFRENSVIFAFSSVSQSFSKIYL